MIEICELIVKGQFIHSCPEDLSLYLREKSPGTLEELAKVAEQFVIAHEGQLSALMSPVKGKQSSQRGNGVGNKENKGGKRIQCFNCKAYGHKAIDCRKTSKQGSKVRETLLLV